MESFLEMLKQWYAVAELEGYNSQEIDFLKQLFGSLPQVLEEFYCNAGRTEAFHHVQDSWMLPEHFKKWSWLQECDYLILLNENQGVCRAGIRREDLTLPDPPVYVSEDDKTWKLCAASTSEFLSAALAYQAVFTFRYTPEEFYWLTEKEFEIIQSQLTKYPFEWNWIGDMKITCYANAPDNLVVIMDCGEFEMLYGATSQEGYDKLLSVLQGVGEPM